MEKSYNISTIGCETQLSVDFIQGAPPYTVNMYLSVQSRECWHTNFAYF